MNRLELAEKIAKDHDLSRAQAARILATVTETVAAARSLTRRADLPVISTIAGETLILLQELGCLLVTR